MLINAVKNAKNTSNKSQSCLTNNAAPHNCLKEYRYLGLKQLKTNWQREPTVQCTLELAEGTYCTVYTRTTSRKSSFKQLVI